VVKRWFKGVRDGAVRDSGQSERAAALIMSRAVEDLSMPPSGGDAASDIASLRLRDRTNDVYHIITGPADW